MSQRRTFLLPDLGEGLTESEVVSWRIAVGDTVTLNQIIAEVETAKAIVELPAPYAGIIARIYAEPGVTVNVGEPLLDVDVADVGASDAASGSDAEPPTMPITLDGEGDEVSGTAAGDTPSPENLVGYGAPAEAANGPVRRARRRLETEAITIVPGVDPLAGIGAEHTGAVNDGAAQSGAEQTGAVHTDSVHTDSVHTDSVHTDSVHTDSVHTDSVHTDAAGRARSTPPVRKLAHELGIDLEQLEGSGAGGAITRGDVEAAFAGRFEGKAAPAPTTGAAAAAESARPSPAPSDPEAPGATSSQGETRIPIHGVRKHTAAAMVQSAFTAPHVSCFLTVDVTRSLELLEELKSDRGRTTEPGAARPGILALTAQAVCIALRRSPELNAHWDEAAQEIVLYRSVHLGIAAATARGLLVPVIPDAQALGLDGLAEALATLSATARAGTTTPAALRGGTFSISNIGVFGVDAGTPILTPGQTGILALGAVRREPREWQGQIALRDVLTLSLSFDHRVVDGAQGAGFLRDVGAILHNPGRVLSML